jgi:hypothetical protein
MRNLFYDLPIEIQYIIYNFTILDNNNKIINTFISFYKNKNAILKAIIWKNNYNNTIYSENEYARSYDWLLDLEAYKNYNMLKSSEIRWWNLRIKIK